MKKLIFITALFAIPNLAIAQNANKTIIGPTDNPPYAAIKPYWVDRPVAEILGRANVQFAPNRVTMNFTIREVNSNADEGLAKLTKRTKPIIEKVQGMISKDDSLSVNYRREAIYEQYKDKDGNRIQNTREDKIENYVLYWDVSITTERLDAASRIKAELLAIGNSTMNGREYYSFVPTTEQSRSLFKAAIADGQERAKMVQQLNGTKLRLLVVQEGQSQCLSSPTTQTGNAYYNDVYAAPPPPAPMLAAAEYAPAAGRAKTLEASDLIMPSSPSKHTLSASVCMLYAIE